MAEVSASTDPTADEGDEPDTYSAEMAEVAYVPESEPEVLFMLKILCLEFF
jgi:hypothetical protein